MEPLKTSPGAGDFSQREAPGTEEKPQSPKVEDLIDKFKFDNLAQRYGFEVVSRAREGRGNVLQCARRTEQPSLGEGTNEGFVVLKPTRFWGTKGTFESKKS